MKSITIAGRIGKDAVTRDASGQSVTNFTVAVDDGYGQKKKTIWFDCAFWGKRGDAVARFLTKGSPVTASGNLSTREHDGKTYLTVNVSDLTLQGKAGESSSGGSDNSGGGYGGGAGGGVDDDSIPFGPEFR